MLRTLLLLLCLLSASHVMAQGGNEPVKTTEKPADPQIDYTQIGSPMPPLRYIVYHDTGGAAGVNAGVSKPVLTNDDLANKANLFVMMFNPNCSHCQDETVRLGQNSALFKKSKLVLVAAPNMQSYIRDFIKYTHFEQYPFMYLGIDSSDFTKKAFLYKALPQINIYNKHRELIKIFSGEVAIDSLEEYIQ
jgi:hypothetical protein